MSFTIQTGRKFERQSGKRSPSDVPVRHQPSPNGERESSAARKRIYRRIFRGAWIVLSLVQLLSTRAAEDLDALMPVREFCISAPGPKALDAFVTFIERELAPRRVNTLILRVDYRYQFKSRPEMADNGALSTEEVKKLVAVCRTNRIRLIPHINLLGHKSWP